MLSDKLLQYLMAKVRTLSNKIQSRRIVKLIDLSRQIVELSLYGIRATEFNGEAVYTSGQDQPIIAIFVGTLYKAYKGVGPFLSGTTACRWYINNGEIAEIYEFYNRYAIS
uniref:Uncharacterized protein n=1 Tax=Arundo donax TaxID=35708 RepID=A0A0A9HQZ5_ARUDO